MTESKAGRVLTLIGGILTLILSGIFLLLSFALFSFGSLADKIGNSEASPAVIGTIFLCLFVLLLAGGMLKLYASNLMKDKKTTVKGGIIAVVTGAIISDFFITLIGGVVAIIEGSRK